ncbi:MAG: RNA polymerase sigma factor [Nitrospira sp.]|nr:MAG: RNA polymerase sigma factor [Nitrospira sp.]
MLMGSDLINDGHQPPFVYALDRSESTVTEVSDEVLMGWVSRGDRSAYAALVDRHVHRMVGIAQRMVGSRADAEDFVQDTFINIWTHALRWQPDRAKFTTWAYRILMNRCIDHQRRPVGESLEVVEEQEDPAPDVVDVIHRQQVAGDVARAMADLPANQRAAISLCYYDELSNIEAAEVLSVSVGAVESLLVRARRRLREVLQPHLCERDSHSGGPHEPR